MFRFDSFKKTPTTPDITNNNDSVTNSEQQSPSFLQRIASSDTLLGGVNNKRPNLQKTFSSSSSSNLTTATSTSFSIPMPTNSWGMLALSRLQDEQDDELHDIVDLLLNKDKVNGYNII